MPFIPSQWTAGKSVLTRLGAVLLCLLPVGIFAQQPTWTDPATGLMWADKDNGSDTTWRRATNHCHNLQSAGYSDWRLPSIDELQGLFSTGFVMPVTTTSGQVAVVHLMGDQKTRLPSRAWSSSIPDSQTAFAFDFDNEKQASYSIDDSNARAVCVRNPKAAPPAATSSQPEQVGSQSPPQPSPKPSSLPSTSSNNDILRMIQAGLPEDSIVDKIRENYGHWDTSIDALIALKQAGATDAEIKALSAPHTTQ